MIKPKAVTRYRENNIKSVKIIFSRRVQIKSPLISVPLKWHLDHPSEIPVKIR